MIPLVSIIVPAYNADRWIATTLESALRQTWRHKEILVVDDGSTDQTYECVRAMNAPEIRLISQPHNGAGRARNLALSQAKGDYIQFLDAEDLLEPMKIEIQLQRLNSAGCADFIASGEWATFTNSIQDAKHSPSVLWQDLSPEEFLINAWQYNLTMQVCSWLVPRHIVLKAGSWNESLNRNDDGEYFCRALLASRGVLFCPGALGYYRVCVPHSVTQNKSYGGVASVLRSIELSTQHLLAHSDNSRTRDACREYFEWFVFANYTNQRTLAETALAIIDNYGGLHFEHVGSRRIRMLTRVIGWRMALLIHSFYLSLKAGIARRTLIFS